MGRSSFEFSNHLVHISCARAGAEEVLVRLHAKLLQNQVYDGFSCYSWCLREKKKMLATSVLDSIQNSWRLNARCCSCHSTTTTTTDTSESTTVRKVLRRVLRCLFKREAPSPSAGSLRGPPDGALHHSRKRLLTPVLTRFGVDFVRTFS